MTRVVLYLSTMLLLGSCQVDGSTKPKPSDIPMEEQIGFYTIIGKTKSNDKGASIQTKGESKNTFTFGDMFMVYGVVNQTDDYDFTNPKGDGYVFEDEASKGVTVGNYGKDENGFEIWKYSNPVAWQPGKSSFFAFSPVPFAQQTHGIEEYLKPFELTAVPSIVLNVVGGYHSGASSSEIDNARRQIKKQTDLLVANALNEANNGTSIKLLFKHTLSRIRFSVQPKHTVGFIRVNSVTVIGAKTKGRIMLAYDDSAPSSKDYTGGWVKESISEPRDFAVNLLNDAVNMIPVRDTPIAITDDSEALMMIPQSLNGITLEVKYAYSKDGVTWENYLTGKAVTVELNQIAPYWKPSRMYNYVLNITPGTDMGFVPDVSDWIENPDTEINK